MSRFSGPVLVALLLVACLPAWAQMIETFKDDQRSKTAEPVMEVYFCREEGGFTFSLYDARVNPVQRVLHKYEIRGTRAETGKMKRAADRTACAGAPDSSLTSESITVEPIPVSEAEDHLWVLNLRMEGNLTIPIAVSQQGLPFRVLIEYHPETKRFGVQQ